MIQLIYFFLISFLFSFTSLASEEGNTLFEGNVDGVKYRFNRVTTTNAISIDVGFDQDTFTKEIPYLNPALRRAYENFWGEETTRKSEEEIQMEKVFLEIFSISRNSLTTTPQNLFKALDFWQELKLDMKVDEEKFYFFKENLSSEIQFSEKSIAEQKQKKLRGLLYSNLDHPFLKEPTIEGIENIKLEDLDVFRKKNFPKESYLISGCGNLTQKEFEEVISFIVEGAPNCSKGERCKDIEYNTKVFDESLSFKGLTQAEVLLVHPFQEKIELNASLAKHFYIINKALELGDVDSILLSKMRGECGLYTAEFSFSLGACGTVMQGSFTCPPKNVEEFSKVFKNTLREVQENGLSQELFEQAKKTLSFEEEGRKTSVEKISSLLLDYLKLGIPFDESLGFNYEDIKLKDVNETLKKYLDVEKLSRFVTYPKVEEGEEEEILDSSGEFSSDETDEKSE